MQPGQHCIYWTYLVNADKVDAFVQHYNANGEWATLFKRHPKYVGTSLYRSVDEPNRFFTVDTWENEAAFEDFKSKYWDDYQAMDNICDGFTHEETKLGQGDIPDPTRLG